jgi:putative endopeptidase
MISRQTVLAEEALGPAVGGLAELVRRQPSFTEGLAGLLTGDRLESWKDRLQR